MLPPGPTLAAQAWADLYVLLDRQLGPLGLPAIEALAPRPGDVVADIGCGAGQTVLQLAERVGRGGRVVGVDIAPVLLAVARRRAAGLDQVSFVVGDAAALALPERSVDALFSRFGVMAFADPAAAFARFHRVMKPGRRLAFVCWRTLAENELDLLPLRAVGLAHLADPAPFSFADPDYVRGLLGAAGFREVRIRAHDAVVSSGGLEEMVAVLLRVGALGRILRDTPGLRAEAEPKLRAALSATGTSLRTATWIVTGLA